jgi:hypothetical protein
MKTGDMVRFAKWKDVDVTNSKKWNDQPKPHVGILVAHDKLMGTAYILYEGEVIKVRSQFAEKAGRKDFNLLGKGSCV